MASARIDDVSGLSATTAAAWTAVMQAKQNADRHPGVHIKDYVLNQRKGREPLYRMDFYRDEVTRETPAWFTPGGIHSARKRDMVSVSVRNDDGSIVVERSYFSMGRVASGAGALVSEAITSHASPTREIHDPGKFGEAEMEALLSSLNGDREPTLAERRAEIGRHSRLGRGRAGGGARPRDLAA